MRKADVFILPSLEDACALVVLEAMASGLPVITSTNNGSGEIISHGINGFTRAPEDIANYVHTIEQLLASPVIRCKIGDRARRTAEESHSWEKYGLRVMERLAGLQVK
jgi:glycosyltransferase involved in cell wall biosynthesis